jgi:hypothetical protein
MTSRTDKMSTSNSRAAYMTGYRKRKRLEEDNCNNNISKRTKLNAERQHEYRETHKTYMLNTFLINLLCMNYVSYFSYNRPILSRTNHQAPELTNVTIN